MIEVCSNKEVEKTWQSGVDRRLQPEAGNFLSHPVQERNITNSEWAKQFGLLSFFLRKPELLGPLLSFSLVLLLYTAMFPSFLFFLPKKRTFYFILKSALFHKTGRFSKKFKHGPFNWKFPIKRKTKSSLPALGGTFFSRFCRINRKGSWYTVSLATLKKLMAASLC